MFLLEKAVQCIHIGDILTRLPDSTICFYEIKVKGSIFITKYTYFDPNCLLIQHPDSYLVSLVLIVFVFLEGDWRFVEGLHVEYVSSINDYVLFLPKRICISLNFVDRFAFFCNKIEDLGSSRAFLGLRIKHFLNHFFILVISNCLQIL